MTHPKVVTFIVLGDGDGFVSDATRPSIECLRVDPGNDVVGALNDAIERSVGEFISFVDAEHGLEPGAIEAIERLLPDAGTTMAYFDEQVGDEVFLKATYSPERHRCHPDLSNLVIYRRGLLKAIGGVRDGFEGAELLELCLRAARSTPSVHHVAIVGIRVPTKLPLPPTLAVRAALEEHMAETGGGSVRSISTSTAETRRSIVGEPLVSIIIPTRGDSAFVRGAERCMVTEAIRSIVDRTTYKNVEFIVVADSSTPETVLEQIRSIAGDSLTIVPWAAPFSFSGKMNLGVVHAQGEFVLLLNDDVEVISADFVEAMLSLAQRPEAGIVGAMLYFDDETIQHAGHAYYRSDVTHIGLHSQRGATGPESAFLIEREVDGVTAACALLRRSLFFEAGGFTTLLPGNFNDVDLCMKLNMLGYRAYWTPHAELYHFESKSRDPRVAAYEIERAWGRWEPALWESKYWPYDPHIIYTAPSSSPLLR